MSRKDDFFGGVLMLLMMASMLGFSWLFGAIGLEDANETLAIILSFSLPIIIIFCIAGRRDIQRWFLNLKRDIQLSDSFKDSVKKDGKHLVYMTEVIFTRVKKKSLKVIEGIHREAKELEKKERSQKASVIAKERSIEKKYAQELLIARLRDLIAKKVNDR
ncbi:hypothetical protein PQO03_18660 [Lentisphaera profundi]|uniref:Uncharacterized protein n=1 Tax=Lentisphaera profundi TaxID=1658616 RepID=A0ABY7VUG4_9BACT|nr:hypothetical protein [Lentisphaera profundi]WDE97850.1 hypothetical protein PQO03_18660 [Lentisphaera profundi]